MSTNSTKKKLNFWMLIALVVGNMVGAGIFSVPAALASIGTISIGSWIFTSIGALLFVLVFIDLNKQFSQTGGPYVFGRAAFGDFVGFSIAYCYWLAWCAGIAGMVVSLSGYLGAFWPVLDDRNVGIYNPHYAFLVKASIVWIMALVNITGIRSTGYTQIVTVLLKMIPLVLITFVGLFKLNPANLHYLNISNQSNFSAFISAATITFWAYVGFEAAIIPAEDAQNQHFVRKATLIGLIITALLYILGSISIMGLIPVTKLKLSDAPYTDAAILLFGHKAAILVALGVMVSIIGTTNAALMVQTHVAMAAARDKLFFQTFAKKGRFNTPAKGFLLSATIITVLLLLTIDEAFVKQFTSIVLLSTFAFLIPYFLSVAAQLTLLARSKIPVADRLTFIKSLLICLAAVAYGLWGMSGAGDQEVYYGMLFFFFAFPCYAWIKWINKE